MKMREFPAVGRAVGEVGLGTWQLGGSWGDIDEATAFATLGAAADSGTTLFDTADVYGSGLSERRIGQFLRSRPGSFCVATKLGRFSPPGWPANFERAAIRAHTEASLQRLGLETVDVTQLHCVPTEVLRRGDIFEHLRELQREGKIRTFGVSVESMEEATLCLSQAGLGSLQIIFNLFRQKPIAELFTQAQTRKVALLIRLPLASGLLGGKMTASTQFPADDHRNFNRDGQQFNVGETFAGLPFEKGVALADELKAMLPTEMTLPQMALRWCLDFPAVTAIIPGARNPEQARANAAAAALAPLPAELHRKLAAFYRDKVSAQIRGPY
jgi:aryl-alcohol dehydrogenase-like predicted oxidoreductase